MASPGTAEKFIAALRAEGVKVREHAGWKTHNRNSKGAWGPVYGAMLHHTVGTGPGIESFVYNGDENLPGPLCHVLIEKDGTCVLIGWGRTNHAGGGDPQVLAAIKAETYPLPPTNEHQGSDGAVDGNAHFIGFECVNAGDGEDPWPAVQLEAMARAATAVCRLYDLSANTVLRHMDWSDWKSDPKGVDWGKMRARIKTLLAAKPSNGTKPPTTPKPTTKPGVSLSRLVAAARRDPGLAQGAASHRADVDPVEDALVKLRLLDKKWADGSYGSKTVAAYAAFQRSLGYRGRDADGIPGRASLSVLASRSGLFTVKS